MIVFDLRCDKGHVFEGWFKDGAAFARQAKRGLVECAVCGSAKVEKAPMAPAVAGTKARRRAAGPAPEQAQPAQAPPAEERAVAPADPRAAHLMTELRRLRRQIEATCDYVGPRFAEEARRIHNDEAEKRSIYGEATPEEAEALAEDGIEVGRIPWVPRDDA